MAGMTSAQDTGCTQTCGADAMLACALSSVPSGMEIMLAQAGPPPPPGRGHQRRQKHLEQLRMLKLLEALDLTEDQETEFLSAFRKMRKQQDEFEATRRQIVNDLSARLQDSSVTEQDLLQLVDRFSENERGRQQQMDAYIKEMKTILTAEQLARMVIFQDRFEAELLDQVRSFQQRRQQNQGGR